MHAVPIPPDVAASLGAIRTVVIGEPGDPTRTDVRPCEYVVTASDLYSGYPRVTALVALDDEDRAAIANGAHLLLSLDGGELPWELRLLTGLDPNGDRQ